MVTKLEVGEIHKADLPANTPFQSLVDDKVVEAVSYNPENSEPLTRVVVITIQLHP